MASARTVVHARMPWSRCADRGRVVPHLEADRRSAAGASQQRLSPRRPHMPQTGKARSCRVVRCPAEFRARQGQGTGLWRERSHPPAADALGTPRRCGRAIGERARLDLPYALSGSARTWWIAGPARHGRPPQWSGPAAGTTCPVPLRVFHDAAHATPLSRRRPSSRCQKS